MASKIEGKEKVIACSWNDTKCQITPEKNRKEQLFAAIKNFD